MADQIQNIDALIQISRGEGSVWEPASGLPVPIYMLIYDTNTRIIKQGDGVNYIEDLPVYFDLSQADEIAKFYTDWFIPMNTAAAGKLLLVNAIGTKVIFSDMSFSDLLTQFQLNEGITGLSNTTHNHDVSTISDLGTVASVEIGVNPNQIAPIGATGQLPASMFGVNAELNDVDSDIVSYLLLARMSKNTSDQMNLTDGMADEFIDTTGVQSPLDTGVVWANEAINMSKSISSITSISYTADTEPTESRMFIRGAIGPNALINADVIAEVSRNAGTDWRPVKLEKLPMINSSIGCYSGDANLTYGGFSESYQWADAELEDVKNNITALVVDTANGGGHFNNPTNAKIVPGCIISTVDGNVVIKSIAAAGNLTNDVIFDGVLAVGTHTISRICGLVAVDNKLSVNQSTIEGGAWTRLAGSISRYLHSVVAIGGKMYVHGGTNTSGILSDTYVYDPSTNVWTKLASAPVARTYHSAVAIGDKMYVHGGDNTVDFIALKDTYVYDPATNLWTKIADGPSVRSHHSAVAIDGKMYVHAGYNGSTYLKDTYVYDPATNVWTKLADAPVTRYLHSAVAIGGKMYVHGGTNGGASVDLYVYDPSTNLWTKSVDAPVARFGHSAVAIGGKMYVHGGYNGSTYYKDTYVYDPATNTWTRLADAPVVRFYHSAVAIDGKMYIYGGHNNTITLADTYVYDYLARLVVPGNNTAILPITTAHWIETLSAQLVAAIGSADIKYTFGYSDNTFDIYDTSSDTYKTIARKTGSIWYYLNASTSTFIAAPINSAASAISAAYTQNNHINITGQELFTRTGLQPSKLLTSISVTIKAVTDTPTLTSITFNGIQDIGESAPHGTDIKWRIRSTGADAFTLHGIRLRWNN